MKIFEGCVKVKSDKKKKKSHLGIRIFFGVILTGIILSAKYYPGIYSDNVKKVIYYTAKEHFSFESVKEFFLHVAGIIND